MASDPAWATAASLRPSLPASDRPVIAALVVGRLERARVEGALRGRAWLRFCDGARELVEVVAAGGVSGVLTELRDTAGAPTPPAIRTIRERFPSVPVVVSTALTALDIRDLVEAARAGIGSVVVRGVDDVRPALVAAFTAARGESSAVAVLREIEPLIPRALWRLFAYCVTNSTRPLTPDDAARALGLHRRTLAARLRRAGLPEPRRVIGWMRLLHAARLLDEPGRRVERVATDLEFPSAPSLHNMLRRYTGLSPAALRSGGAFRAMLEEFKRELSGARRGAAGPPTR